MSAPHATAGVVTVQLRKLVSGVYQTYATGSAPVAAGSQSFSAPFRITSAGTYAIRFVHADADHLSQTSVWVTFVVR